MLTFQTLKFCEVQKYFSVTNHAWNGPWMVANAAVWKSLPPDLQQIIERNNTKSAKMERHDTKVLEASVADKLRRSGIVINEVDTTPFRGPLRPHFDYWANAFGPTEWGILQASLGRRLV